MNRNNPLTTRATAALLGLAIACAPLPAPASPLVGVADETASDALSGLALSGFDPVSYFLPGGPRPGRRDLDHLWAGAAWRFASEANREAFLRAPGAYAPRLGGHDAEAAASGRIVDADPAIFGIQGGRLYLFRTSEGRARFLADPAIAARAEARWESLRRELVGP